MKYTTILGLIAVSGAMAGCSGLYQYKPGGGLLASPYSPITYYSTEQVPKTITIVDLRSDEPIFVMEIPVGQQLVLDFEEAVTFGLIHTPELMRYQLFPLGTQYGPLESQITVPVATLRRIDVTIRPDGLLEQRLTQDVALPVRSDELLDQQPVWGDGSGPQELGTSGLHAYD
jgi:hypothetical protein